MQGYKGSVPFASVWTTLKGCPGVSAGGSDVIKLWLSLLSAQSCCPHAPTGVFPESTSQPTLCIQSQAPSVFPGHWDQDTAVLEFRCLHSLNTSSYTHPFLLFISFIDIWYVIYLFLICFPLGAYAPCKDFILVSFVFPVAFKTGLALFNNKGFLMHLGGSVG